MILCGALFCWWKRYAFSIYWWMIIYLSPYYYCTIVGFFMNILSFLMTCFHCNLFCCIGTSPYIIKIPYMMLVPSLDASICTLITIFPFNIFLWHVQPGNIFKTSVLSWSFSCSNYRSTFSSCAITKYFMQFWIIYAR